MKSGFKITLSIAIMVFLSLLSYQILFSQSEQIMDGDIIFQKSKSSQASALLKATKSDITHVGIIFFYDGKPYVIEALHPVVKTPYSSFLRRFGSRNCFVKRISNRSQISSDQITKLRKSCERYLGKKYDLLFRWDDDKIYCSELVWKAYHEALGIDLGVLQKMNDFDLSSTEVKLLMKKRGMDKQSINETVITPVSIFNDKRLVTISI